MKSALLVMDIVTSILQMNPNTDELLDHIAQAIAHARQHHFPIIYIKPAFRQGLPEISDNNKLFVQLKPLFAQVPKENFHPKITPLAHDIVIGKFRIGAFSGNELEIVLRSQGINHLILTGISTSGIVLTTVREAADKDYQLTVLSDACYDRDPSVHACLMEKVFPRQAQVLTVETWHNELNHYSLS